MMNRSAQRAFSLLISAALIVGSLIAYGLFIKPAYSEATTLRGTLFAKQALFEEKSVAVQAVESLIKQYQGVGSLQNTISLSLPLTEDAASVFNQVQALAGTAGLSLQVFNVQAMPLKSAEGKSIIRPLGTLRPSFKLIGSYEAFKQFIAGFETNIRVMDVVSIKVEPAGQGASVLMYTVVADTYYQSK